MQLDIEHAEGNYQIKIHLASQYSVSAIRYREGKKQEIGYVEKSQYSVSAIRYREALVRQYQVLLQVAILCECN